MQSSRQPLVSISSSTVVMNRPRHVKNSCCPGLLPTHLTEQTRTSDLILATNSMNANDSRLTRSFMPVAKPLMKI